jgi:hypothetical protein
MLLLLYQHRLLYSSSLLLVSLDHCTTVPAVLAWYILIFTYPDWFIMSSGSQDNYIRV